jgi:hypothetical protein
MTPAHASPLAGGNRLTCGLYEMAAAMAASPSPAQPAEEVSADLAHYIAQYYAVFKERKATGDILGDLEELPDPQLMDKRLHARYERDWHNLYERETALADLIALHPCRNAADVGEKVRCIFHFLEDNRDFETENIVLTVLESLRNLGLPDPAKA